MSTGQCPRCRATYGCMCNGSQSTGANWDTVSNPMGALQIIHEQSNEIRSLRAALDEANTERERLTAENQNLRESADTAVFVANNVGESYRTERDRREDLSLHLSAAEADRDRAVAQVERVAALCDEAKANVYGQSWVPLNALRAALAGEGSEQPEAKPGSQEIDVEPFIDGEDLILSIEQEHR